MRHERVFIVKNFIGKKSIRLVTLPTHVVGARHLPILQTQKLRLGALQNCCPESGWLLRTWRDLGAFQDLPLWDANSQFVSEHPTSLDQTWGHDARTRSSGGVEMSPLVQGGRAGSNDTQAKFNISSGSIFFSFS